MESTNSFGNNKTNESGVRIENNVLSGGNVAYQSNYTSLGKFVLDRLESSPDLVGQVDALTGEEYTYEKMRERSIRCALWMKSQGLLPGDVITICSHNQLDMVMPCFAALYLGAIFNPLYPGLNKKDLAHLLSISKSKIAFTSKEFATVIADAAKDAKVELKTVVFDKATGFHDFESVIAEPEAAEVKNFRCTPISKSDAIAAILSTSGTTGSPKGVALSHGTFLRQVFQATELGMRDNIYLYLTALPWITGVLCVFISLFLNKPKIIAPPLDEYSTCMIIEKYKVNWIFLPPRMVERLLRSGALSKYNLSSLKQVACGGKSLRHASQEALAKFMPNARFTMCYGMTELGCFVSLQGRNSKPGSSGRILHNVQLKVIDPDTGRILGANQEGELLLKSGYMMNSYYRNPQATAEAVDKDGWLHSGDLGYYDEDGEIFVIERLKELIKYRGYHISPSNIENLISSHPGVKDVAVVPLPHPLDDEHPIAFVVRRPDSIGTDEEVTEKELIDLVATEMSDSYQLRGGVKFIDDIPKTPSEKVQRKELRALAKSMVTVSNDQSQ